MKESELHQSSGIALSIINPNNGTHVVMNIPPGQRKGQLLLRGPFGERWIYLDLSTDVREPGDQDLEVTLATRSVPSPLDEVMAPPPDEFKIEGVFALELSSGGPPPAAPETEELADYSTAHVYVEVAPPVSVESIDLQLPPVEPAVVPVPAKDASARHPTPKGKKAGG